MQVDDELNKQIGLFGSTMLAVAYKILKSKTKVSRAFVLAEICFALLVAFVIAPAIQEYWSLTQSATLAIACLIMLFSSKILTKAEAYIDQWGAKKGGADV